MSEQFAFDVFLSHSSKDKPIVREIAQRLKADGIRVWLDEEQIKPGDSIPAKVEEGLENSRVLILCMSANAFGSDWAKLESYTYRFRDPLNKDRRFIPLRLDDAPIKGSLAQFSYVDWQKAVNEQKEYEKLFGSCKPPSDTTRLNEPKTALDTKSVSLMGSEAALLKMFDRDTLKIGNLDMKCMLFPPQLWSSDRNSYLFIDHPEYADRRITLHMVDNEFFTDNILALKRELGAVIAESDLGEDIGIYKHVANIINKGSAPYPRIINVPTIDNTGMNISVSTSMYGISLINELGLSLPTAIRLRRTFNLNSLAVRVGLVYQRGHRRLMEFQQRIRKRNAKYQNATYQAAWDVSASGYINQLHHTDPDDPTRISPWIACKNELTQELGIDECILPNRELYIFFGLGMNASTRQQDLLAICECSHIPLDDDRGPTAYVQQYDRCEVTPEALAGFVLSKKRWVPTAILTIILALQRYGYTYDRIINAFSPLANRLELDPYYDA